MKWRKLGKLKQKNTKLSDRELKEDDGSHDKENSFVTKGRKWKQ